MKDKIESFADFVTELALRLNAIVVDAEVRCGDNTARVAELDIEAFIAAASALRPRAIYMTTIAFDIEAEVEGELIDEERIAAFQRKWNKREGQSVRVVASFASDGIHHLAAVEASWIDAFRAELVEVGTIVAGDMEALQDAEASEKRRKRREAMKILVADPRFDAPKGSKAKREFLAETLFPAMTPREITDVVSDAESALWLERINSGQVSFS